MSDERSATYNVSGTVTFGNEVTPERAEELLRALGAFGLRLHLQVAGEVLPTAAPDTPGEDLSDRFVTITDMVDFAEKNGIAANSAAKVWHAVTYVSEHNKATSIGSTGYKQIVSPKGKTIITDVSLSSLKDILATADYAAPPHIRSRDTRGQFLERAVGGRLGPKSVDFLRRFVDDIDTGLGSGGDADDSTF